MAPGIGGNGGGGSRQTGTVPKTKSHNESSREYNGTSRREYQHFNHMPNNLSSLDWQPVNDSLPHSRSRKESNTSASRYSEFDAGEENTVSQDNLWFNTAQRSQAYHSDDDEVSQASWTENGYKSNNLGLPDKAQVATRLHQIRDYVNQTMSMMESLRINGGQRNMAQHEKLSSSLEGLRDSELKLQTLYERLQRLPPPLIEGDPENFSHQDPPQERANKPSSSVPKPSEAARRNELQKQVQVSQLKLQELQEQQAALKSLRQKAQEQLKEARAAQGALISAHHGINQQTVSADNMIQDRLHNLQRFFDTRHQMVGLEDGDVESSEMQNKLDELQAKKQHMDQLLAQFSNLNNSNVSEDLTAEECDRDVENKMAELNVMRDTLTMLQSNISAQLRPHTPHSQERAVKNDSRAGSMEKSNATTGQAMQIKTQQLQEAKAKLQQLQTLLRTVEELRHSGQPIPESVLQLMSTSDHSSSPTQPDRSEMSFQDLNISQPVSERLVGPCERGELFSERGCRSLESSERERVNHQQPINGSKHNNQQGKLGTKMQLEELMRNQDLSLPQPLQSSSFQENGNTAATWGSSTQGTMDESYNPDYTGDMNESGSVKNATSSSQPHNVWQKTSMGSGSSRLREWWGSPYVPQEVRSAHPEEVPRSSPLRTSSMHSQLHPTTDIPQQPDSHWIVHQISQLQSQLQQMTGLYKNFVEKQHNCPPPWVTPPNISAALGPYCHYIASASQWQQQQLLVHSLNQCCQLIWHQQRELAALKEALRLLQQPQQGEEHFSPQHDPASPPSNLSRTPRTLSHAALKTSLSAGPSLAPAAAVSSAHSLPNLASPQTTPASPIPANNRNLLSSPTATVLSLPPTLNNAPTPQNPNLFFNPNSQFTDPNFINLYPPYGNNINLEFPSPVNFFPTPPEPFLAWATSSQPQPAATLNNQVPPGNRANNYWDNFRSYSRQNLLSNSGKSNDGLPQRTPLERFLNTDPLAHPRDQLPLSRSRKERLNAQSGQMGDNLSQCGGAEVLSRVQVHAEPAEEVEMGEIASGYHPHTAFCPHTHTFHNIQSSSADVKTQVGRQVQSPPSFQHNVCNDVEARSSRLVNETELRSARLGNESEARAIQSARLVNDCEAPRGANKKVYSLDIHSGSERKLPVNKRNYIEVSAREAKISQLNNYHTESSENNTEAEANMRPINHLVNGEYVSRPSRSVRNINTNTESVQLQQNCIGDGYCLMASDKGVRRKDNKGNVAKECKTEINKGGDSLEECVYSEVAALISVNEWRPQFLLQLFKDLRLLSSCADPGMQAALSSIHTLATRTAQVERSNMNEETAHQGLAETSAECTTQQPRNWSHKETPPQLPTNCAKLDWEVRSILVEMLPFIKSQLGEACGPPLLEAVRKLILHLVPSQSTQDQLDAQLEDALHKFHGCRLGDVYEELLTVVADVLISELTFLRLVNTVHHSTDQQNGEEAVEEGEDEEGAVGGVVGEGLPSSLLGLHPANQPRRAKSETVSEADLAEADQSRHNGSVEEEERGDKAEGIDQMEEDASGREFNIVNCNGNVPEHNTEASWAVEQDRELGLDQVPTRLHNPETEQEALSLSLTSNMSNPGPSDPGQI